MSKNKKDKDWKPWQENLFGFIVTGLLIIMTCFFYDESVHDERTGTKSKGLQHFLKYLDESFGKEYVFVFLTFVMLWLGIRAIRGYIKDQREKEE
ncbi:hypothetical protein [Labilibaculum sp.]|uniref:hypothetical protein n=1 Tax=Labilibaculum sp. TaxID=2060723 RepID=UPI002AA89B2B|nr:hypothetical protein [Labilibaculum sp.]